MHSKSICRECQFPIQDYKQLTQTDPEICEFCVIAKEGSIEFPDSSLPPGVNSLDTDLLEDLML